MEQSEMDAESDGVYDPAKEMAKIMT